MAFTYLILNVVFLAIIVFLLVQEYTKPSKAWYITLAILLGLTLVFDNLIIIAGIVGYDTTKILGLYLGKAPIEDFFYALLAVIIVPVLWKKAATYTKPKKDQP